VGLWTLAVNANPFAIAARYGDAHTGTFTDSNPGGTIKFADAARRKLSGALAVDC
jgi:hypothetical protein